MKKLLMFCVVAGLMLAASSPAQANEVPYVSTFSIVQADFNLSGFSTGGPTILVIDNVIGAYALNIPPAGSWDVSISGWLEADFDKDGTYDAKFTFDEDVGNYASPGPSTSWAGGPISFTVTDSGPPFPLSLTAMYAVDVAGVYPAGLFGPAAHASFTISGPDIWTFNALLTALYNLQGGGVGVFDWHLRGGFCVTAIPEPATICLLGLGGLALLRKRRA